MEGELLVCRRCDAPYDLDDNYCRRCGAALRDGVLPAPRDANAFTTTVWEPRVPSAVMKGAAVVAAGTLARVAMRALVGRMLRPRRKAGRDDRAVRPLSSDGLSGDVHFLSETLIVRRVRVRG